MINYFIKLIILKIFIWFILLNFLFKFAFLLFGKPYKISGKNKMPMAKIVKVIPVVILTIMVFCSNWFPEYLIKNKVKIRKLITKNKILVLFLVGSLLFPSLIFQNNLEYSI